MGYTPGRPEIDIRLIGVQGDTLVCRVPDMANEVALTTAKRILCDWAAHNGQRIVRLVPGRTGDVLFACRPGRTKPEGRSP